MCKSTMQTILDTGSVFHSFIYTISSFEIAWMITSFRVTSIAVRIRAFISVST
ncbi:unnamed protein product [Schistosoma curassoni]|uniref:Uncharacterized protein n=1 Tax=Schistosoma curassoni TaxID=6186 RepID=A0A183K6A8_9TREM|nr:unnamed protein product [Schistosoma curassoni]